MFDLCGVRCSILICYDNNLSENPRIVALMGAEVIFAPHVTGGLPSPMPGRGKIDRKLWDNRHRDPVPLRLEFPGPQGPRLAACAGCPPGPTRTASTTSSPTPSAWTTTRSRPGNAMIIDPFGEILAESSALGDDVVVGLCTPEKIELAGGRRYLRARRPDLYAKLAEPLPPGRSRRSIPAGGSGRRRRPNSQDHECSLAAREITMKCLILSVILLLWASVEGTEPQTRPQPGDDDDRLLVPLCLIPEMRALCGAGFSGQLVASLRRGGSRPLWLRPTGKRRSGGVAKLVTPDVIRALSGWARHCR